MWLTVGQSVSVAVGVAVVVSVAVAVGFISSGVTILPPPDILSSLQYAGLKQTGFADS